MPVMRLAIIIIAYNEERYLSRCLQAIRKQVPQPDELIVVDNNSTDQTAVIAKSYGARVVEEKQQGMIYARNLGFNVATADILGRIDADTILLPGWVEEVKKCFADSAVGGLSGPVIFYDFLGGGRLGRVLGRVHQLIYFKNTKRVLGHEVLFGSNMAIRREAWLKVKNDVCLDGHVYHEDGDLTAHISRFGKILYSPTLRASISARRVYDVRSLFHYAAKQVRTLRHAREVQKSSATTTV